MFPSRFYPAEVMLVFTRKGRYGGGAPPNGYKVLYSRHGKGKIFELLAVEIRIPFGPIVVFLFVKWLIFQKVMRGVVISSFPRQSFTRLIQKYSLSPFLTYTVVLIRYFAHGTRCIHAAACPGFSDAFGVSRSRCPASRESMLQNRKTREGSTPRGQNRARCPGRCFGRWLCGQALIVLPAPIFGYSLFRCLSSGMRKSTTATVRSCTETTSPTSTPSSASTSRRP